MDISSVAKSFFQALNINHDHISDTAAPIVIKKSANPWAFNFGSSPEALFSHVVRFKKIKQIGAGSQFFQLKKLKFEPCKEKNIQILKTSYRCWKQRQQQNSQI